MRWLKSISTDDNWDADGVLYAIIISVLFTCFFSGWNVLKRDKDFDAANFGTAIAAILGAGGAGYAAKRFGERSNNDASSSDDVSKS